MCENMKEASKFNGKVHRPVNYQILNFQTTSLGILPIFQHSILWSSPSQGNEAVAAAALRLVITVLRFH